MKIESKEVAVPATSRTVTTYACDVDGCAYSTDDKEYARQHHGKEHAAKAKREINEIEYVKLLTEEDHAAFLRTAPGDRSAGKFTGAGWYALRFSTVPCGSGCCSDSKVTLVSLDDERACYLSELETIQETLGKLDELAKE